MRFLSWIKRHTRVEVRIDHKQAVGREQKRVPVRRRFRDKLADEIAARARLILNHDGLAELAFEATREQTGGDVGSAPRRQTEKKMN